MQSGNMFFISHSSSDSAQALALYNLLLEIEPSWKGKIFLDCAEEKPLESHDEWRARMLKEVEDSRYLIFITSSLDHVKEGNGWLYEEVSLFQNLKANRNSQGRGERNLSYFGIFLCQCDFENALFSDRLRGSEYRRLYQRPEHLVLDDGATVESEKDRIKGKINTLICGDDDDEFPRLLLEKSRAFAAQRVQNGTMIPKEEIVEALLPFTCCEKGGMTFDAFCDLVRDSHVQLLGNEGGCGKTTLLTKLFYHYKQLCNDPASQAMIPLYVDAKSLFGENNLILRYLAKHLFDEHTAMTDSSTSKNVAQLSYEFSQKRKSPRYLLIIDGYNELPERSVKKLSRELLEFLPNASYPNVRVVISGRHISCDLPESVFEQVSVEPLGKKVIRSYLEEKGHSSSIQESLYRILSIPMYLKMYTETTTEVRIENKADLLCAFLNWQQTKDRASAVNEEKKELYQILLRHVLPAVAYGVMTNNKTGSSFVLTLDALEDILYNVQAILFDSAYRRYYGSEYREQLRESNIKDYDEQDLADIAIKYFVHICKILRQDSEDTFDFVHQIYRDFFCAWFVAEEIRRALKKGECCTSLSSKRLDGDVIEFVTELLKEERPRLDLESRCWDYSCNERSSLVQMLDIIRRTDAANDSACVANVMRMLKYARKDNLSGLDLSLLDLTGTDLRGCCFSRHDKTAQYPTSFTGAKINRENLFTEDHFNEFVAACANQRYVACVDSGGVLKLWEKKLTAQFPVKIITDVRYSIRKLLFHPDNRSLYAMTAHEILEIPIPEAFISRAQARIVFKTPKRLRDMVLDENGGLLFTTNMNSFNFKSVDAPDAPDQYKFYGINSAAGVNTAGDRLAFGYIAGLECLKLFDIYSDGTWQERKFGYGAILNDYISELENFFRDIKLYHRFPTDNEGFDKRRTYFSYMQQQFMDRTHDHDQIPQIIADRCRKLLEQDGSNPIKMYANQIRRLENLVHKYEQILKNALTEQGLLMLLSGRKITGLNFKKGSNTLLISSTIDYAEKLKRQKGTRKVLKNMQHDSVVLELDTDTYETKPIARYIGEHPLHAFYCGDDVVVMGKYRVVVYDKNGAKIATLRDYPNVVGKFIALEGRDTFYAISRDFIYEMDKNLHCVKSFSNDLGATKLCYYADEQGREFLAKPNNEDPTQSYKVMDLLTGKCSFFVYDPSTGIPAGTFVSMGDTRFKTCGNKLVCFFNNTKKDEMTIPYKLFVCGCDFTGVRGTVTDPQYLQTLYRMGAVTDPVTLPDVQVHISEETFVPSAAEFVLPGDLRPCPYAYQPDQTLEDDCYFSDAVGGNDLYIQKTWALINKGSFSRNALEEADYSIMEWVSRLVYAQPCMINDLVAAGIIAQPRQYRDAGKRLIGPLHKTYKFVFRSQFCVNHVGNKAPIFTVEFPYGAKLLQHITNKPQKNPLLLPNNGSSGRTWAQDGKNRNICIFNPDSLKEIRKTLALNRWFTLTARRYKEHLEDYSLDTVFDTDHHFNGRANINGYIRLNEQPFFAQAVRSCGDAELEKDIVDKVKRLCIIAVYYRSLVRYGQQINQLHRQPVIVIIGEDLDQCQLLNRQVQHIYPNVRKLFTFDTLLVSDEAFNGAGNYFEFVDGVPHSVKLQDLL